MSVAASPEVTMPNARAPRGLVQSGVVLGIAGLVALAAFGGSLADLLLRWSNQDEYSHGYLIPVIAVWLLWRRHRALAASPSGGSWAGVAVVVAALLMNVVGELSAIYILAQLGFVLSLMGLVLAFGGWRMLTVAFIPICFLLFAIPLPYFIDAALSLRLQLLSSELAGGLIRLFGVPVYIDGNVIDLGNYKLQVVDACSGLRYLFPLMSLGFLAGYLLQAPFWQRAFVFLSTIPITIAMNSLRIALVGVMTSYWGSGMAEGILHLFEGWVIFLACAAILVGELYLIARLAQGKPLLDLLFVPQPAEAQERQTRREALLTRPLLASLVVLAAGGWIAFHLGNRGEITPDRTRFVAFPNTLGEWRGRASALEPQTEHALGLDDYVLADYSRSNGRAVNFYVAYYASQRKGSSPHSPLVCVPGGGWQITQLDRTSYRDAGLNFPINRVVVERGQHKQLVYYWFEARGRRVANEWISKWYLLVDAVTMSRTDGALVRLTTPLYPGETEADADTRIRAFIPEVSSSLSAYLPAGEAPRIIKPAALRRDATQG